MHACAAGSSPPRLDDPAATLDWAPPAWIEFAACRGRTDLFFAPYGEQWDARERREAAARQICRSCPVLEGCRRWAREHREYGFWGGETEEDRAAVGFCVAFPTGRQVRAMRRRWNETVAADRSPANRSRSG